MTKPILIETSDGAAELVLSPSIETFTRRKNFGTVEVIPLKRYEVLVDGKRVGIVEQSVATFERKPRGSRIVTKRWSNVRWYFCLDKDPAFRTKFGERRSTDIETRKRAVEGLLHLRAHRLKTAAEADPTLEFIDV